MTTTIDTQPLTAWRDLVLAEIRTGSRLAGLFGTAHDDTTRLTAILAEPLRLVDTDLPAGQRDYPALTPDVGAAFWYERALHDLFGIVPTGHPRLDPLVLPLPEGADRPRPGALTRPDALHPTEDVLGRHVVGPGVFTIPHGPVRSGVFESVEYQVETPGEDVLFPQIRVHYKHRGIEKRFEGMTVADGVLLAERSEGIASVAHALAYAHAVESLSGVVVPPAARLVRVLHAELERVANHLDVALRLCEAAGLAVAVARFGWHKECVLRLVSACCGNRFGRGVVVPGGVTALPRPTADHLVTALGELERDITGDERALMGTASFLDRLRGTGPLPVELAAEFGALGPIGRASGRGEDAREADRDYQNLDAITPPHTDAGDAMARLRVRWAEAHDSFDLANQAVQRLTGTDTTTLRAPVDVSDGRGTGRAEAPQGEVVYVVELADARIIRCHPRSASFHNLPLFHSVFAGDILTDFPFIEASFGLSIAGVVM
ncbi:MAG TPA: NADH-quinone oxidoreductase subunit C [Pseudonocardiaceae bacterium]|nr:NADH-quinone oxidoreductase subunit C [Pseudonocardiaceae bacterium]